MPINLLRSVFRERRRFAVLVLLIYAALKLAGLDAGALPMPPLLAAPLAALTLALVAALAPSLRGYTEAAALACVAVAALARALPGTAVDLVGTAGDGLVVFGVWVGFVAVARGTWRTLGALPQPRVRRARFQARAGTRVDVFRLWHGLVPTPGMAGRYGDPEVIAIDAAGLRQDRIRLVNEGPERRRETLLQVLDLEAPFHVRLRTSETDDHGAVVATGVSEIFLVELGPKRLVLFAHEFPDLPLGRAILAWLDDSPGRLLDRRLATIERRARAEDAHPAVPLAARPVTPSSISADDPAPGLADHTPPSALAAQSGRG